MTRPRSPQRKSGKKTVSLRETFEKGLRVYGLGAGAAASLLALPPPALAEIIFTETDISIYSSRAVTVVPINIDGTPEFKLTDMRVSTVREGSAYADAWLYVNAGASAAMVVSSRLAAALKLGAVIGPAGQFQGGKALMADAGFFSRFGTFSFVSGKFANTTDRYLGLKFTLHGQVHYGWARFSSVKASPGSPVGQGSRVGALFTGYAFETVPNKPIYAGQTRDSSESRLLPANDAGEAAKLQLPTLGLLALGSLGLNAWRKKEAVEAQRSEARTVVGLVI